jgi:molybdenum ABC transporter molybdate-binding protein
MELAELDGLVSHVSLSVLAGSKQPQAALHFARFVAARDRGLKNYEAHGFQVVNGDVWSEVPELSIFAGSMLRPAIEESLVDFEKREGVRVTRVYNGCGILVAQMKAGQHPDAYFACDQEFMKQVPDLFPKPVDVSTNQLVILVQKGNPLGIESLRDLGKKGVRVGVGHDKQCAMGWLTQRTFTEAGLRSELMENVVVQTPTGDMLVNQMRSGSLDAAVVYLSNAAGSGDVLDAVRIDGLSCSIANQPYGVATGSTHRRLAMRLLAAIETAESREIFEAEGFRWLGDGVGVGTTR